MSSVERFAIRCCLTGIVVAMSAFFLPFMLLLKLVEGVLLGVTIASASVRQVWGPDGLQGLGFRQTH